MVHTNPPIDPVTYCSLAAAATLGFPVRMVRDRGLITSAEDERFYAWLLAEARKLAREGKQLDLPSWTI